MLKRRGPTTVYIANGDPLELSDPALYREIDAPLVNADTIDFAVRNRGFIVVAESRSWVRIRLRLAVTEEPALVAALRHCWESKHRVLVELFSETDETWQPIIADTRFANDHIWSRYMLAKAIPTRKFSTLNVDVSRLSKFHPARNLLARWRERQTETRADALWWEMVAACDRRTMLIRVKREGCALILERIADGYSIMTPSQWLGRRLEDQLDYDYGCWAAQAYRVAHQDNEPKLSLNEVELRVPVRRSGRYERIILPCKTADGGSALLSGTWMR